MANTWTVEAILTWISMHINYFTLEFFSSSAGGNCWDKTDRAVLFAVLLRLNLTAIRIPFSIAFGLVTSAKRKALARLQTIWSWRTLWKSQRTLKEACQVWVWGRRPLWSMTFVIWSQACGLQLAFRRPLARSTGSYSESVILLVIGHAVVARCFNLDSRMNELRLHIASEPPWATWHNFISQWPYSWNVSRQIGAWIAVPALFGIIAQAFDSHQISWKFGQMSFQQLTKVSGSHPWVGSIGAGSQVVVAILGKEQWSNTLLGYVGVPSVPSPSEVIAPRIMIVWVVWQCQILVDKAEVWSPLGTWICTNFFQATLQANRVRDLTFAVAFFKLSTSFQNFRLCWPLFGSALPSESSPQIAEEFSVNFRACWVEGLEAYAQEAATQPWRPARWDIEIWEGNACEAWCSCTILHDVLARSYIYITSIQFLCTIWFAREDPWTWTCTLTELYLTHTMVHFATHSPEPHISARIIKELCETFQTLDPIHMLRLSVHGIQCITSRSTLSLFS